MPDTDGRAAWLAGERARRAIAETPFELAGTLTISAGVAELREGMSVTELFRRADAALYWAKDHGRNACMRFTPAQEKALIARRAVGESRLASGVERLVAQAQEQLGLTATVLTEVQGRYAGRPPRRRRRGSFDMHIGREISLGESYLRPHRRGRWSAGRARCRSASVTAGGDDGRAAGTSVRTWGYPCASQRRPLRAPVLPEPARRARLGSGRCAYARDPGRVPRRGA